MSRERQENLEKYQQEMQQSEISLENAELCSRISKYSAEDDRQLMESKDGFETVPGARARTRVDRIDGVEVIRVVDGKVQPIDPKEVERYDTEGNKTSTALRK